MINKLLRNKGMIFSMKAAPTAPHPFKRELIVAIQCKWCFYIAILPKSAVIAVAIILYGPFLLFFY